MSGIVFSVFCIGHVMFHAFHMLFLDRERTRMYSIDDSIDCNPYTFLFSGIFLAISRQKIYTEPFFFGYDETK